MCGRSLECTLTPLPKSLPKLPPGRHMPQWDANIPAGEDAGTYGEVLDLCMIDVEVSPCPLNRCPRTYSQACGVQNALVSFLACIQLCQREINRELDTTIRTLHYPYQRDWIRVRYSFLWFKPAKGCRSQIAVVSYYESMNSHLGARRRAKGVLMWKEAHYNSGMVLADALEMGNYFSDFAA